MTLLRPRLFLAMSGAVCLIALVPQWRRPPAELAALIAKVESGEINAATGKKVFARMFETGKPAAEIIAAEGFSVRLSHRNVHAQDCADCETKEGNIGEITREIIIEGDVSAAERARLMDIADRCPVHRTLSHEIKIRSSLAS